MGSADFRMVRPVSIAAGGSITTGGGTYYDSMGTLRTALAGALRVTYDPADLSAPAYPLIELAATNFISLSSLRESSSVYSVFGPTVSDDGVIAGSNGPDGVAGVRRFTVTNPDGLSTVRFGSTSAGTPNTPYAGSIFARTPDGVARTLSADTCDGVVSVIELSGQWQRIETVGGNGASTSYRFFDIQFQSNGAYEVFGVQVSDREGSYIPNTTGAPVTRPADVITGPGLAYSSAPEATVTEYASGTTYIDGDIRGITTGTAQAVYRSRKNGNLGNAPASSPTWWRFLGTVYAAYAPGTYALDAIVTDLPNHQLYQSLAAGNTAPLTDKTKWLPLGATTRWKCFDKAVNSQTTAPELLTMAMVPGSLVNTLTALNVSGSRVTVTQTDSGYKRSKSLVRHDVLNWYDWFYEEPIREGDVVFDDIPPYAQSALTITIENPGDTAGIGCCFVGKSRTIGKTAWELTGGILSYSTTNTDTFGNVTFVKRESAKRLNFEVYVPTGFESEAYRLLKQYTDVEMVFIGASDYSMTIAYGFLGQWAVPISNRGKTAPIEVRGLI